MRSELANKKKIFVAGIVLASAVTLVGYLVDSYMLAAAGFALFAITFVIVGIMG
ncbi:MAG: hypothetical protein QXG05_06670 [Nitrososphaerota archaeon]